MESDRQPLQVLFAGKAHPHDHAGKELIRDIVALSRQEPFAGRMFFLEDYDINIARFMFRVATSGSTTRDAPRKRAAPAA